MNICVVHLLGMNTQKQNGAYNSRKQGKCKCTCNFYPLCLWLKRKNLLVGDRSPIPCERPCRVGCASVLDAVYTNGYLGRRKWSTYP